MIGKPYQQYEAELTELHYRMDRSATIEEADLLLTMARQAARVSNELCWQLEAGWFEISYKHREAIRFQPGADYTTEDAVADLWRLYHESQYCQDSFIRPRILFHILNAYRSIIKNYELAFDCARLLAAELEQVRAADYAGKLRAYIQIGELYYSFRDYEDASFYFSKVLDDPEVAFEHNYLASAYNSLGLVARNNGDREQSSRYFRQILSLEPAPSDTARFHYDIWQGIASSNLARNLVDDGRRDEAIPLYRKGIANLLAIGDYVFVSNSAVSLADLYIGKNDLAEAWQQLELARDCIERSVYNKRYHLYYPVLSRYYAARADVVRAIAYMDSAMKAQEVYYDQFNALQLIRSEQRAHRMEQLARDQELRSEQLRATNYRRTLRIVSVGLALVVALLYYVVWLYRKKRTAYRALVLRTREWAEKPLPFAAENTVAATVPAFTPAVLSCPPSAPEEDTRRQDETLAREIQELIETEKLYLDPAFTLDSLASRMAINRFYLSRAINQHIGKKFNDYVNAFRIREAVRLLSNPSSADLSIDHIAAQSGFNDRKSFYRVFKKLTGLSPSEYRQGQLSTFNFT